MSVELEECVTRIQSAYPRIYLACHSRHQNAQSTEDRISQRDASLLAHLSEKTPVGQGELARHMAVAKSTLSEALAGLEDRGFVIRQAGPDDARGTLVRRTREGTEAMSGGSVLESARLRRLLARLSEDELRRAVEGLELIALATERKEHDEPC
jgi:DNA-binding MarR family transcriptional regulator